MRVVPPSDSLVWVRRLPFYDTPVRATYSASSGFIVVAISGNPLENPLTIQLDADEVHTWKFQYLADEETYQANREPSWPP
jgi:hypothetical protein